MNSGMSVTCRGSIIVASTTMKSALRPRQRKREKA